MEEWKLLGAPLAAVVVVLTVLLKSLLSADHRGPGIDSRLATLEARLETCMDILEEVKQGLRELSLKRTEEEQAFLRHQLEQESRLKDIERRQDWLERRQEK